MWFCADLWVGVRMAGGLRDVSKAGRRKRRAEKGRSEKKNILDKGGSEGSSSACYCRPWTLEIRDRANGPHNS